MKLDNKTRQLIFSTLPLGKVLKLKQYLKIYRKKFLIYFQITTFSRLLSPQEQQKIQLEEFKIECISLMQFQTEHSFREALM